MEEMKKMLAEQQDKASAPVTMADFQVALKKVGSSVGGEHLKRYADWMEEFGSN